MLSLFNGRGYRGEGGKPDIMGHQEKYQISLNNLSVF